MYTKQFNKHNGSLNPIKANSIKMGENPPNIVNIHI